MFYLLNILYFPLNVLVLFSRPWCGPIDNFENALKNRTFKFDKNMREVAFNGIWFMKNSPPPFQWHTCANFYCCQTYWKCLNYWLWGFFTTGKKSLFDFLSIVMQKNMLNTFSLTSLPPCFFLYFSSSFFFLLGLARWFNQL